MDFIVRFIISYDIVMETFLPNSSTLRAKLLIDDLVADEKNLL